MSWGQKTSSPITCVASTLLSSDWRAPRRGSSRRMRSLSYESINGWLWQSASNHAFNSCTMCCTYSYSMQFEQMFLIDSEDRQLPCQAMPCERAIYPNAQSLCSCVQNYTCTCCVLLYSSFQNLVYSVCVRLRVMYTRISSTVLYSLHSKVYNRCVQKNRVQ